MATTASNKHSGVSFRRFYTALLNAKMSQADLARAAGVSRGTVHGWFDGRPTNLRPRTLFAVADALNVEARWLATGEGPMTKRASQ